MRRHWIAAVLLTALILTLCGCGARQRQTVSMDGLRENMLSVAPSLPEMSSVSDADTGAGDLFAYLSDMSYDKVEHFFLSYSAKGLADEIAVIAVKDPSDAASARDSLERHLKDRTLLYQQYQPDQVPRVENAELFIKDQYVVLIVCDEAEAVKRAFTEATTEG